MEQVPLPTYETLLAEAIKSLAVDSGTVSSPVAAGSNTLSDQSKRWATDVLKNRIVKVIKGVGAGQQAAIAGNALTTLRIRGNWPGNIGVGATYVILGVDAAQILMDVLTGGFPVSATHPVETHDPKVEEVEDKLDHPDHGLAALKAKIDSLAGGAFYGSYGPKNVEVDNDVDFGAILYDPAGNIITTGEITPGTYTVNRVRGAVDTEIVGTPDPASSEAAGRVYITYNFPAASWNVGDIFYITFKGIVVTIDGVTTEYPNLFIWGRVVREADISSKIDAVEVKGEKADYGTAVYFDDATGIAGTAYPVGTPSVPSNSEANVKTIADALNIRDIHVHGAFTVPATMEHYCWYGAEHEDVTDVLDLNGQDVDSGNVAGLIVTGTQGGTGFLTLIRCVILALLDFQGRADFCDLYGSTIRLRDGGYADFLFCNSIHGVLTVTVQAPTRACFKEMSGNLILTAQDGGTCFVRGFKGTLEIDAMTAGTLSIYANGADITINADCTGGTINIYGNAEVTGVGGGVTINKYTLQERTKGLDAIFDAIGSSGLDTQIRRVASGTSGVIAAAASKYIEVDSGTNGAEILAVIINGAVGADWTLDVYVPTADAVGAPAAGDKRDSITYAVADTEGGLLKPFGLAYNTFLKFTNDSAGNQTVTDVVVVYRSRGAITIGAWT